ncbi:MAG: bacteriohopanetetrol glucosamine biosynthesis glycosyltransferase HpnI [Bryobacteraceae bacterium]
MITIICALAIGYQLFAVVACLVFKRQGRDTRSEPSPVSILKPVHGVEPSMREAIASHATLQGNYEFLCGVRDGDPAAGVIAEFTKAEVVPARTMTPNGKVGVLMDLAEEAQYPILIVNDADIRVETDYISRVTAPLHDPQVGLVTCLYRAEGSTFAARFEGLGIATDFAPSTLVARLVGVDEFAMGSTMAFRRETLDRIGGFAAIKDYLADDYQLGQRVHALGLKCMLSDVIVTTHLGGNWSDVWHHQVRWSRTIRVSNFWGYLGLPVTFASVWAVIAALTGNYTLALLVLAARMLMASVAGGYILNSMLTWQLWPLIPLRDLFGAAIWCSGLFGKTVLWRGRKLRLDRDGRITV